MVLANKGTLTLADRSVYKYLHLKAPNALIRGFLIGFNAELFFFATYRMLVLHKIG